MNKCYYCGKEFKYMPFLCKRCAKIFCSEHRLPEDHHCPKLKRDKDYFMPKTEPREIKIKLKKSIIQRIKDKLRR